MTMGKVQRYREILTALPDWDSFLLQESGLPGPRGNLELAQAVADEGDKPLFRHLLSFGPDRAPTNSPYEFLAFCGALGLGKLLAGGNRQVLPELRRCASDPRWRMREGVAMALQRWGEKDMDALLKEMEQWSRGTPLEQRAAAAALCEPRLLSQSKHAKQVLRILDGITAALPEAQERKSDEFRTLRQGLGYCWSVAVAALPEEGKRAMEGWLVSTDPDVRWIMRENLKKNRLLRMDRAWVQEWSRRLGTP
jgi:3-methyladenine DNA glycosylase AlkC